MNFVQLCFKIILVTSFDKSVFKEGKSSLARYSSNKTLIDYDRGVRWEQEELTIKGQKWNSAYLPIWLYSYRQLKSSGESLLHYVAVNAKSMKTMGSVPINKLKLLAVSSLVQILGTIIGLLIISSGDENIVPGLFFLLTGVVYYGIIYMKYRNTNVRFEHEKETRTLIDNIEQSDVYIKRLKRLKNGLIKGLNTKSVNYNGTLNN